jgi:periplasmic protein TonB
MFEQSFQFGTGRTRRAWTVPVSFCGQIVAVGFLAVLPLIFTEKLPVRLPAPSSPLRLGTWHPAGGTVVQVVRTRSVHHAEGRLTAPSFAPHGTPRLIEAPEQSAWVAQGTPCIGPCGPIGVPNGVLGAPPLLGQPRIAPSPPLVQRAETPRIASPRLTPRIRVGTGVQEAKLVFRAMPVYPRLALAARIAGTVRLSAVIGAEGRIRELRAVGGHPMLIPAAMDAVRQWIYRPTMLDDEPVEVATEIIVRFILSD